MQRVWRSVRWISGKLLFFAALLLTTVMLIRLPALLVYGPQVTGRTPPRPHIEIWPWLRAVWQSLTNILRGNLVPPVTERMQVRFWDQTVRSIWPELTATLELTGTALVIGIILGLTFGWLMSRLGPARLRRGAWGTTTLIGSIPDLLLATGFDLALVLLGRVLGFRPYAPDLQLYYKHIGPSLALALLIAPYIARVTAAAIAEISGHLYVRTALAKGVPYPRVVLQHIGRNVIVQVCTVLPVVTGILLSGAVMVEYMTEVPGIGRGLVLLLAPLPHPSYTDPSAAILKLLPLLVIMTAVSALTEALLRWVDPRAREPENAVRQVRLAPAPWRVPDPGQALRSLGPAAASACREWLSALPARLREGLKALRDPVLLAGALMVLGLVTVAVFADQIAPYPPNKTFMAFQDASGHIWVPGGGPDALHPLGTDGIGRDIFSQLIFGTRFALLLAALVVPARFLLALFLGLAAAWWGGIWDRLVRWLGVFFTAVPQLVVPLVAIGLFNRAYANNVPASLAWGVFWVALPAVPRLANAVKQMAMTVFSAPFLESAVAVGAGPGRILLRHVLPQMKPQLVTMIALEVPLAMTMMATLSYFRTVPGGWIYDDDFRGVPANPEWGSMMDIPVIIIMSGRWWLWAPFAALFIAVLAFNLLGEGLRRRSTAATEWRL